MVVPCKPLRGLLGLIFSLFFLFYPPPVKWKNGKTEKKLNLNIDYVCNGVFEARASVGVMCGGLINRDERRTSSGVLGTTLLHVVAFCRKTDEGSALACVECFILL